MSNALRANISPVRLLVWTNALLALAYVALIAVVMSYAALHVEYAEEVRSDEAAVASLEATYFASLSSLTATDYRAAGYEKPSAKIFVESSAPTAFSSR